VGPSLGLPGTGGVVASHNGDSAIFKSAAGVLKMSKYLPSLVLAFGFLLTVTWIALIAWFPVQLLASAIPEMLSVVL
jgi:hypothetical protein